VFGEYADTARLAQVLNERAGLEYMLGHMPAAADLRRAALRLFYARPEPQFVAVGHYNLADYLGQLREDAPGQRAHRLAAALIVRLAGMAYYLAEAVRTLRAELSADDAGPDRDPQFRRRASTGR
jgi:hypothetical protein